MRSSYVAVYAPPSSPLPLNPHLLPLSSLLCPANQQSDSVSEV